MQTVVFWVLKGSVFLFVLALGLRATMRDATYLLRRPRALIHALVSINGIMVVLAVALVLLFELRPAVRLLLVALALSPVPPILPRRALKAGGVAEYTIGLLVAAALASIVLIPLTLETLQRVFAIPLGMSMLSIAALAVTTILLPLTIGMALRKLLPSLAARAAHPLSTGAFALLVVGFLLMLFGSRGAILSLIGKGTIAAFVAFTLLGLAVGHLLGRQEGDSRRVLALATATRHPGVALAIAHANRPGEQLAPAAVLFLLVNAVVSAAYVAWYKRRDRTEREAHGMA
jgi:BASS family bile acid:Na+ symporter